MLRFGLIHVYTTTDFLRSRIGNSSSHWSLKVTTNYQAYSNVRFLIERGILSVTFDSAFGEISVSLSIEAVQARLSEIVSKLLDSFENDDPRFLDEIAKEYGIPRDDVRKSLELAILYKKRGRPHDAIEQFLRGKDMHLQGTVEQFIDNLPAGIVLLLSHMAIVTIAHTIPDVQRDPTRIRDNEILGLLTPQFKKSIAQLWRNELRR